MTELNQIYRCESCGNMVQVIHASAGQLVCCGNPMKLLTEQTADSTTEKHVPVITKVERGYRVVVGSTRHPMIENHYIEWIELIADGRSYRQYLHSGDQPEAFFGVEAETVSAREYCNIHGLWKS